MIEKASLTCGSAKPNKRQFWNQTLEDAPDVDVDEIRELLEACDWYGGCEDEI